MYPTFGTILFMIIGAVHCAPSKNPCPPPISLENGQASLHEEGNVVEYVCNPGYVLIGKEIIRCVEGKWEESSPDCLEIGDEQDYEQEFVDTTEELPSVTELEEEKQSLEKKNKSESGLQTAKENKDVQLHKDAALMNDEGYQSDDAALRQLYWYAHYYPSLYHYSGAPSVMTLTDSQYAWINSLHPELRDQYLKNMHVIRIGDNSESGRTAALIASDAYNYIYSAPYVRRPVSVVDEVPSTYDYSCNRAGYPAIPAPKLRNMRIARYDSRKNVHAPHNYYLSAIYQCEPGYYMLDSRFSELYCSRGQWVGISPVCVKHQ